MQHCLGFSFNFCRNFLLKANFSDPANLNGSGWIQLHNTGAVLGYWYQFLQGMAKRLNFKLKRANDWKYSIPE